jgi:hypothetical protein
MVKNKEKAAVLLYFRGVESKTKSVTQNWGTFSQGVDDEK